MQNLQLRDEHLCNEIGKSLPATAVVNTHYFLGPFLSDIAGGGAAAADSNGHRGRVRS